MGVRAGEIDVALRDGSTVRVRAVREADADALAGLYGGLSERSRIFRFFSAGVDLRKAAERSVASAGSRGGGLVALVEDCVIGHAEYIRYGAEEAEVAFAVADDWQGHGISSLLLVQLAEAAGAVGVTTFSATVMSGNHKMVGVFRGSGFPVEVRAVEGDLEVTFPTALDAAARRRFEDRERAAAVAAVRHVLTPASVALIGAGTPLAAAVERGLDDFGGPLRRVAGGEPVPDGVELAVVTTPAEEVLPAARACAAAGVRALLVLSDLVAPTWMQAAPLRAELLSVCRDAGMRLVGPGSLGVLDADPGCTRPRRRRRRPGGAWGSRPRARRSAWSRSTSRRGAGSACPRSSRWETSSTCPATTCCSSGTRTPARTSSRSTWSRSATPRSSAASPAVSRSASRSSWSRAAARRRAPASPSSRTPARSWPRRPASTRCSATPA